MYDIVIVLFPFFLPSKNKRRVEERKSSTKGGGLRFIIKYIKIGKNNFIPKNNWAKVQKNLCTPRKIRNYLGGGDGWCLISWHLEGNCQTLDTLKCNI